MIDTSTTPVSNSDYESVIREACNRLREQGSPTYIQSRQFECDVPARLVGAILSDIARGEIEEDKIDVEVFTKAGSTATFEIEEGEGVLEL